MTNPQSQLTNRSEIDNSYDVPFRSFIVKNSGDIVRISALERDPQISMTYIANTMKQRSEYNVSLWYPKAMVEKTLRLL